MMSSHLSVPPQLDFNPPPHHLSTQRIRQPPNVRKHQQQDGEDCRRNSYLPKIDGTVVA